MKTTIASLPNELLLDIFSHLSYTDLKISVSRVCKRFRKLVVDLRSETGKIDEILFRDKQPRTAEDRRPYTLHPIIQRLRRHVRRGAAQQNGVNYEPRTVYKFRLSGNSSAERAFLRSLSELQALDVYNENATSPARQTVWIRAKSKQADVYNSFRVLGRDGKAVTVADVVEALVSRCQPAGWARGKPEGWSPPEFWYEAEAVWACTEYLRRMYGWLGKYRTEENWYTREVILEYDHVKDPVPRNLGY